MNNLIEQLKNNKTPFGLCTKEEQECFEKVGKEDCEAYCFQDEKGIGWHKVYAFAAEFTYRIKTEYKPQEEYEYSGIFVADSMLLAGFSFIECLLHCPNFRGFGYFDNYKKWNGIWTEYVAKYIADGFKVQARFIK